VEELFRSGAEILPASDRQETAGPGSDSGGTLLLDQIEDLSPRMQLSMLKIIDSKKLPAQGRTSASPFDVRIMVSSQLDLRKLVEAGKFKDELYYRLNILELVIPPLRDRKDDIAPLCSYFIQKYAGEFSKKVEHLSEDVISTFMTYDFPGNVRELEHIIERAVILADGNTIEHKHLPRRFLKDGFGTSEPEKKFMTLAELEKQHILEVMEAVGGNKSKATELLGISRTALWRKLKTYEEDSRKRENL
jgi:two-component system response regulator AtoC